MTYNPKNPDATFDFKQYMLEEREDALLNIIPISPGLSTVDKGNFQSKNFQQKIRGWRIGEQGNFEARDPSFFSGEFVAPTLIHGGVFTDFGSSTRCLSGSGGSGSVTFGTDGVILSTGATASSYASVGFQTIQYQDGPATSYDAAIGDPVVSIACQLPDGPGPGSDFQIYAGIGNLNTSGSSMNFNNLHVGFKITRSSSGAIEIFATIGTGSTEIVSPSLGTLIASNAHLEFIFVLKNADNTGAKTYIDFYYRAYQLGGLGWNVNGIFAPLVGPYRIYSSAAGFSGGDIRGIIINSNVATTTRFSLQGASYIRTRL